MNALAIAAKNGHVKIVNLLLNLATIGNHPRPHNKDAQGKAAIHHAIENGHLPVVEALLAYKNVNINIIDDQGKSPLVMAIERDDRAIIDILLKNPNIEIKKEHLAFALSQKKVNAINLLSNALFSKDKKKSLRDQFINHPHHNTT